PRPHEESPHHNLNPLDARGETNQRKERAIQQLRSNEVLQNKFELKKKSGPAPELGVPGSKTAIRLRSVVVKLFLENF
ncbi:hypothetical protein OAH47_04625, partial [Flavobacteriaceae bacterium]|nr:hypothetical protein [Flavobacteriaceae bacterium]